MLDTPSVSTSEEERRVGPRAPTMWKINQWNVHTCTVELLITTPPLNGVRLFSSETSESNSRGVVIFAHFLRCEFPSILFMGWLFSKISRAYGAISP